MNSAFFTKRERGHVIAPVFFRLIQSERGQSQMMSDGEHSEHGHHRVMRQVMSADEYRVEAELALQESAEKPRIRFIAPALRGLAFAVLYAASKDAK